MGYYYGVKKPLNRKVAYIRYETITQDLLTIIDLLAINEFGGDNPDLFDDPILGFDLAEEYANAGIKILVEKIYDKFIKSKGFNPKADIKLFKESEFQGIEYNIKKFKGIASKEVEQLEKIKNNRKLIEKLTAGKFAAAIIIPTALMGFVLPKLNFALTKKIKANRKEMPQKQTLSQKPSMTALTSDKNISFTGNLISTIANMKTVDKMAITDGGLTIGRVATARNKFEKLEMGFKMSAMMFLNFIAPIWIAKSFDKISNKLFNTNVNLDPRLLVNKKFLSEIQNNTLKLPEENVIEFLDNNQNEMFSKLSEKYAGVKYLKNGVRDPRAYVDEKKVIELKNELVKFAQEAKNSTNIEKYAKKALRVKTFNILSNVTLSSFLLAIALPKLTFILRKKITGSDAEPGLAKL